MEGEGERGGQGHGEGEAVRGAAVVERLKYRLPTSAGFWTRGPIFDLNVFKSMGWSALFSTCWQYSLCNAAAEEGWGEERNCCCEKVFQTERR
jgi:hypothetical protein